MFIKGVAFEALPAICGKCGHGRKSKKLSRGSGKEEK